MKNKLIMLVGLPSSGKSTYAKKLKEQGYIILSSDSLREEMFNDIKCQDMNDELFKELHKRIKDNLLKGNNVCYDACNINYKKRMAFLEEIKFIECTKICVVIAKPYEMCISSDAKRQNSVGETVITRMYYSFFIPQYYEGWDDILIIQNYNNSDIESEQELWKRLNNITQDNPYHTKTIGGHCISCYNVLMKHIKYDANDLAFKKEYYQGLAALWHDIGKFRVKKYNEQKGYCTFYNHQHVGAYDTMIHMLLRFAYKTNDLLYICNLIQWHMQPFNLQTEKSINKFVDLVGEEFYNELLLLHESDKLAK